MADVVAMWDRSSKPDLTAYTTYLHPEATMDDHRQILTAGGVENAHKAEHRKGPYIVVEQGNEWSLCHWVVRQAHDRVWLDEASSIDPASWEEMSSSERDRQNSD